MRTLYSILICILTLPFGLSAQQFKGRVMDADNGFPIAMVLITNTRSGSMWLSDSIGRCAFSAQPGDIVRFEHTAYKDYKLVIQSPEDLISIRMERAPIALEGVTVESPYKRFSQDSAFMRAYFHKELGYSGSQIGMNGNGGVGVDGLVSELALVVSGKKKRAKQFAEDLRMLEEWRYEAIRYTPNLVMMQTGLDDSSAREFIAKHPMPPEMARTATELAMKAWIREEFKASGMHAKQQPVPVQEPEQAPISGTIPKAQVDSLAQMK